MMKVYRFSSVSMMLSFFCLSLPQAQAGQGSAEDRTAAQYLPAYKRPTAIPYPTANAHTPERELLGKTLFFDPRLSGSSFISCATCHNPAFSWGDGLAKGIGDGMKQLGRRSPTILDLAWGSSMFWDGRMEGLEEQALGPIASPGEMNMPLEGLEKKVAAIPGYQVLFAKAYPDEPVNAKTMAKAIATFERTVVSGEAPFDRWVKGKTDAISTSAKRGFILFNDKAKCAICHSGWRFTDDGFHDIGVPGSDPGRGKVLPEIEAVQHSFKTPTLRNVALRAPFMHDGSEARLEDVVELYNLGGRERRPSLADEIKPLNLSDDDKNDLIAFMQTLTSNDKSVTIPLLPR